MSTILYYHPIYIRPIVAMCLAEYFKADIKNVDINTEMEVFTKDFPIHQCPALINRDTGLYLTETVSIQQYIIKAFCKDPEEVKRLLGSTILEEAEILRWDAFSVSDFLNREVNYVEPLIGMLPYNADAHAKAKTQFEVVAKVYEDRLKDHQFLVGDHITLADLSSVSSFFLGFNYAFDANWSQQYPNITRWYKEVTKSPYISNFFEGKEQAKVFPQPPK